MSHASYNKQKLTNIYKALESFTQIIRANRWRTIQILTHNTTTYYTTNHLNSVEILFHSFWLLLTFKDILDVQIFFVNIQEFLPWNQTTQPPSFEQEQFIQETSIYHGFEYFQSISSVGVFTGTRL
jgi:hypothetical protein